MIAYNLILSLNPTKKMERTATVMTAMATTMAKKEKLKMTNKMEIKRNIKKNQNKRADRKTHSHVDKVAFTIFGAACDRAGS